MFFIFLLLLSVVPICVGVTIVILFQRNKLSKSILFFLTLISIWQIDVAVLYGYEFMTQHQIEVLFKIFRIGSIMVTPTIFYLAYIILQNTPMDGEQSWRTVLNKKVIGVFYVLSFGVYLTGWSKLGISHFELKQIGSNVFYFPIYGSLSWVFYINVIMLIVGMFICFFIIHKITDKNIRSFLFSFNVLSCFGYFIGTLNVFPIMKLYPSSIALLLYTSSILILFSRMYLNIVSAMNNKLSSQKKFLFQIIDLNPNYIYAKDEEGRYTLVNKSFANLVNESVNNLLGKTEKELTNNICLQKMKGLNDSDEKKQRILKEEFVLRKDEEEIWLQSIKVPIDIEDDVGELAVLNDITERKQFENQFRHQANHDALTGLPNRRMFNEELEKILAEGEEHQQVVSIMLLDLDRFKYINDTLGHDVGDQLLMNVTTRIIKFIEVSHPEATVYRLGGDEFVIVIPTYDTEKSKQFADELLKDFERSFLIDNGENYISASIGISIYPKDGQDANTLLKHADTAMYYVKAQGKANYQLFSIDMQKDFYRKMMIEKYLRTALEQQEFELHYQPIVDLKTNKIVAMESLLRWDNEMLGKTFPDEFISVAEETGLIVPIGEWVIETAIAQQKLWQQQLGETYKISVNISVRQLLEPQFMNYMEQLAEKVDTRYVVLEITESIAMYDESMIEKLHILRDLKYNLSMDDFGTGYSSLSYLNKYPLHSLKIDKSFVMGIIEDSEKQAIVETIVTIAKQLHLYVIAEGVETKEEYQFLANIGCTYAQGYFISRPLPAKSLLYQKIAL